MAFRADEAAAANFQRAVRYLTPKGASAADQQRIERKVGDLVAEYGPVVDAYPTWHPLVAAHDPHHPVTRPGPDCGYEGLDHTILFAHAFVTCPYQGEDNVVESVRKLGDRHGFESRDADIEAEVLDKWLYNDMTKAVLVTCSWGKRTTNDHAIPKALAVPMMLERELPCRHWAQVGETWETMRPYFLGDPHGARSSLFIAQETGTAMRTIWKQLVESGAFGPIKV